MRYKEAQEVTYDERYCQCDNIEIHDSTAGGTRDPLLADTTHVRVPCADCINDKDEDFTEGHGTSMVPYKGEIPVPGTSKVELVSQPTTQPPS